ncbi:hypothetical protein [Streptomyces sp. 6N223]|uniref:hypothetical protein n=1 Tax=Streptomyces sp. 6N223 TaxID=3457412 RepID=UPI003FD31B91
MSMSPSLRPRVVVAVSTLAAALTAGAILATVAGGSSSSSDPGQREYALPDTLCGLEVPRDLYAPLFGPGARLSVEGSFEDTTGLATMDRCTIELDGELTLWTEVSGQDSFEGELASTSNYIAGEPVELDYEMADGVPVDGEYEAMVWPGYALAGTSCRPSPGAITNSFTLVLRAEHPDDEEESVQVLSALIQPYMRAALTHSQCEPGPNPASGYSDG